VNGLEEEARSFRTRKDAGHAQAAQVAAFFLMSGIDLDEALSAPPAHQRLIMLRVERLLERERLRGGVRHWSYDLNRHIALKQALDRLIAVNRGCSPVPGSRSLSKAAPIGTASRNR